MPDLFGMQTMTPKQQIAHIAEHYGAADEFEDWLTVLKKKKVASTPSAWKRRLQKVMDLIESGENIQDVFAQSADSGWTGLFEVRDSQQKTNGVPKDNDGCIQHGASLGIEPRSGETWWDFRARVEAANQRLN